MQQMGFCMFIICICFMINIPMWCGKVAPKETGIMNTVVGFIIVGLALFDIVTNSLGDITYWAAVQMCLFGFTYVQLGVNNLAGNDSRGLGWYCLFVTCVTPLLSYQSYQAGDMRLAVLWPIWGALWFLFFPILSLGKAEKWMPWFRWVAGISVCATLLIPSVMMMNGWW
jgi:hypothetical protein